MSELLLTQEVGSIAKPDWRVQAALGNEITKAHVLDAAREAASLGEDPVATEDILCAIRHDQQLHGEISDDQLTIIKDLSALHTVRLQERAGIDILFDGEQDRSEMYQYAIERTRGFDWRGRVRAFDNRSYRKAACVNTPSIDEPWHTSEVTRLQQLTNHPIKVPITGAYTLAAWSYNEQYDNTRDLTLSLARDVIRPNIQALLKSGVEWIQIDEPAATTIPEEVPLFVESFNESVAGLAGRFSVHICFSDYSTLFPYVSDMDNCDQFSLEFANRDGKDLGVDAAHRPAYTILGDFARYTPNAGIGLGVTSIHEDALESPELVRDRVIYAVDAIGGDPTKIYPSPDCGLRTRSRDIAFKKLQITAEGAQLARVQLQA